MEAALKPANEPELPGVDPMRGQVEPAPAPAPGDLALVGALLGVSLVPIAGELAHAGRFGAGTVGFATALALVFGRELCLEVRALVRDLARPHHERPRVASGHGRAAALPSERRSR